MMYGLVEIDHVDELGGEQMNYNLGLDKNLDTRRIVQHFTRQNDDS